MERRSLLMTPMPQNWVTVMDNRATGTPRLGTPVEVRCRFDGLWAAGFELAEATSRGYRLRRVSDGYVLPREFDVREFRTII
jgi:hypothetical protein